MKLKGSQFILNTSQHISHSHPWSCQDHPTCSISERRRLISILVGAMVRALCRWLQSEATWRWLAYWWKLKQIWIAPADMAEVLSKSLVNVGIWRQLGGLTEICSFTDQWPVWAKVEVSGNGVVLLSRTVICLTAFDLFRWSWSLSFFHSPLLCSENWVVRVETNDGCCGCKVVRLLILAGVDVNLTGRYGRTPLQLVAQPFEKTWNRNRYCWFLEFCTTRDVWNPMNNGING